jgi:hypothetical protein
MDVAAGGNDDIWAVTCVTDLNGPEGGFTIAKRPAGSSVWTTGTGTTHASRIAVAPEGTPWIVNVLGDIWVRSSNNPGVAGWVSRPGIKARDLAVSADYVAYATGTDEKIYIRDDQVADGPTTPAINQWFQLAGSFGMNIAAGNVRNVWVTNTNRNMYQQSTFGFPL